MNLKRFASMVAPLLLTLVSWFAGTPVVSAATTIDVSTNVLVPSVKRMGIDFGMINYYDSGQVMKELVFRNPGFEGLLFQSVVAIGSGTATNAVENGALIAWPSGFWDGANYDFIYGAAKGRTGTVSTSINPVAAGGNTNGTTYAFGDSGIVPSLGDFVVLRKHSLGDGRLGGAACSGWNTNTSSGGMIASETNDLPPGTLGRQCIRLMATNSGAQAAITASFDTWPNASFIQINGRFRLAFEARGVGGANRLLVQLRRGSGAYWINQTLTLANSWQHYTLEFTAAEDGTALGIIGLTLSPVSQSAVLLDDVSLRQVDGDPSNTTAFRDAVVNTLRSYNPGVLRKPNWQQLGNSLENELAAPFARQRSGYTSYGTTMNDLLVSLPEWLSLCEALGAEPWYPMPVVFSTGEVWNLMEYLGGGTNTVFGALRAAHGHPLPWTSVFSRIHLELGNENWNSGYRGGAIADPVVYGIRGNELFGVIRSSPYFNSNQFDLVLNGQAAGTWLNGQIHAHSTNHTSLTLAPYLATVVNNFASNEELYGSLFAEPEFWSKSGGFVWQTYTNVSFGAHPVAVSIYEVNLHTTRGAIAGSQATLSAFTPSLGVGLAVADHMLMMLRELKARDQGLFSLPGYEFQTGSNTWSRVWGVARDMGVTDRKRPQFLAVRLLNEVLAGNLVETTHHGDDPTWNVTNVNRINYTGAHYLQSYAFSNGRSNAVVVFNLHRTDPLTVNFAGNRAPAGSVTLKRLSSNAITDNNENSENVFVTTQSLAEFDPGEPVSLPPFSLSVFQWAITPPSPLLSAPEFLPGGNVRLVLSSTMPGMNYHLQVSTNLLDWISLVATNASGSRIDFIDSAPGSALRFYRAVQPP
jgi:alpha-L-arabinofuranosidase